MKAKLLNLIARLAGIGSLWDKVASSKTYLAGTAGILTGVAGLLLKLLVVIEAKDAAALWALVQSLPQDPNWLSILGGLGAVGLRHAIEKQEAPKA